MICPYLYDHELAELRTKFGLDQPQRPEIEFCLWQDTERIGPDRAFQRCWEQYPDRDIIIIHSDMAPWPGDPVDAWYDDLCHYRDVLPRAGMIAANLFYPTAPNETLKVQSAGGTFRNGVVSQLHGDVSIGPDAEGITADDLARPRRMDWVTFGGVLIRRDVIEACGPFDPHYVWAYYRDVDYCLEARIRGFQIYQVPARILHEESRTTRRAWTENPELQRHIANNHALLLEKWRSFIPALPSEMMDP